MIETLWPTHIYKSNINDTSYVNELFTYFLETDTDYDAYGYSSGRIQTSIIQIDPLFNRLCNFITECVSTYTNEVFKAKSQLYTKVSFSRSLEMNSHYHHEAVISGAFYINALSGALALHDPRSTANRGFPLDFQHYFESHMWMPSAGDIIIFPSYLSHEVPYDSDMKAPRFVMPFDSYSV